MRYQPGKKTKFRVGFTRKTFCIIIWSSDMTRKLGLHSNMTEYQPIMDAVPSELHVNNATIVTQG
jgi:hypothetical protein